MRRFAVILLTFFAAGTIAAASSDARTELTFCKTSSRAVYLLVSKTSCHEGRVVTHAILGRGTSVKHLPPLTHPAGWTCRITDPTGYADEPAIRCRRRAGELIWAGLSFRSHN